MADNLPTGSGSQLPAESVGPNPRGYGPDIPGPPLAGPEPEFNLRRYIAAVLRFRWLVILVTILGTGAGAVATRFLKPEYGAQATIWIQEGRTGGASDRGPIRSDQLLETHGWVDLLKSFVVLDNVVLRMRLHVVPGDPADSAMFGTFGLADAFRPGDYRLEVSDSGASFLLLTAEGLVIQQGAVGDSVGTQVGFLWIPPAWAWPSEGRISFSVSSPRDAALRLRDALQAQIDRNGNFMRLELRDTDGARAAATLNATADRYVEVAADLKRAKLTEKTKILDEQLRYAARNLGDAEMALESFRVRTITLPTDRAPVAAGLQVTRDPVFSSFFDMRIEREQLRRDREAIERTLANVPDSGLAAGALLVVGVVQESADLGEALRELTEKQAELRGLRYRYTDENPRVRQLGEQIRELETQAIPALGRRLISDVATRETELARRLATASRELREIPIRAIEEARLRRAVEIAEDLFTDLKGRYEEARLAEASSIPDVRILDAAVTPRTPVADTAIRLIAVALFGSLGIALLGAIALDRLDRRVRYPEQVSEGLGLTILGAVPHVKLNGRGMGRADSLQVVESLRAIRLGLVHAYGTAGPLILTISSPGTGDGKSFVASNLALSFAEAGHRTLLIDGDVRRGELHRLLGARRKPGLTDYLAGASPDDVVQRMADSAQLHFIGAGTRLSSGPEMLNSRAMSDLMLSLRSSYGVILIDSPPLGAGVDPFVLSTITGSMLLVMRTGVTDRELAEAKLDVLDRLPIRVLGAVLNDIRPSGQYRYYAYQYYTDGYEARDERPIETGSRPVGLPDGTTGV